MVIGRSVNRSHVDEEKLLAVFTAIVDDNLLRKVMDKKNKEFQILHDFQVTKHAISGNKEKLRS